jgi:aspartyl-tRNA(Asn)/glutamyl-tRNA(Gln) amidotransferase subunit B
MNSFRAVYNALNYEIERQSKAIEAGEKIVQETRGWNEERGVTLSQRSKEFAHDYRYFPEPDLPPLAPGREWVDEIRAAMPELPDARRDRYQSEHGLSAYDAALLAGEREYADLFDQTVARYAQPKAVANWINGDVRRLAAATPIEETGLTPPSLAELLQMLDGGQLNRPQAVQVLEVLYTEGGTAKQIAAARGLQQVSDEGALLAAIDAAIAGNPKSVADYKSGKKNAMGFLVGQVMKATRGQANPSMVNQLLAKRLDELT